MIRTIQTAEITRNIKEMCIEANHFLAEDMEHAMKKAAEKEKSDNIVPMTVNESSDYNVDAAHAMKNASAEDKAFDEDIMNSEDF